MTIREIFTVIFLSLGFICFLISAIGVFRLRDFYARLHAAGICESAGLVLCSIGFLIYEGFSATVIKIFAVFLIKTHTFRLELLVLLVIILLLIS